MTGSKIIHRTLHQVAELYPNANTIKAKYEDGKFEGTIYCPDIQQHIIVRSEIIDLKFYVSFGEVKVLKNIQD